MNKMWRLWVCVVAAVVALACGSTESDVRKTGQKLTLEQSRVMGFEAPTSDWRTNNGSPISDSSEFSEGSNALKVTPNGYTEIASINISAPGSANATATYDLRGCPARC